MKILQVAPFFPPAHAYGGMAGMAFQISKELIERDHEVVVYTSDAKDIGLRININPNEVLDGIEVHYFRSLVPTITRKLKLSITPMMILHAKNEVKRFDVVHLHDYRTFQNIVAAHYSKKFGVPYMLQAHGTLPRLMNGQKLKWVYDFLFGDRLLKDAFKVIAVSRAETEQYRKMGLPPRKIAIVPNGINLCEYSNLPPEGSFKRRFGITESKMILYLGRIHKVKGLDFLVKAYAHLIKSFEFNDAALVIAGPDDGYLDEVQALVHSLGMEERVLIPGPLYGNNRLAAYSDADVCVLPSRYEIWGLTILEAYACKKPVIASRVGGLKELVIDKVTGFLFNPGDIRQLARHIFDVLSDRQKARRIGLKGRDLVEKKYTSEKTVEKLEKLYFEASKGAEGQSACETRPENTPQ
jgi:glycosyltransferase involved in cell wall biosynthesis